MHRCKECGAPLAPPLTDRTLCGGGSCDREGQSLPVIAYEGGVVTEVSDAHHMPIPRGAADGCARQEWARTYCDEDLPGAHLCWFRMPVQADWFASMMHLALIRKRLLVRHILDGRRMYHLTVLAFRTFSLFALNAQEEVGAATRVLWPLGGEKVDGEVDAVRVLDLSPRELHHLLEALRCSGTYRDEAELARYMLDVVLGELRLPVTRTIDLRFRSSFLKCVRLEGGQLGFSSPNWWLTRRTGWKKLPPVTHHQVVCYLLASLFLAEPRHALATWPSMLRALELVRDGLLSFEQLFRAMASARPFGKLLARPDCLLQGRKEPPAFSVVRASRAAD